MERANHDDQSGGFIVTPRSALCLDFANTLAWRGSTPTESLHNFADLITWCANNGLASERLARRVRKWPDKHPRRSAEIVADAIAIREAIYLAFHGVATHRTPGVADLDLFNRVLHDAPRRTTIRAIGDGFGWQLDDTKISATSLLAPVLWSAGDLLVGTQCARVRECFNDKCLWLFLDDSKNGTRRWCSMRSCGNRAKAHRHYLRQKQSGAG